MCNFKNNFLTLVPSKFEVASGTQNTHNQIDVIYIFISIHLTKLIVD